MMDNSWKAFYYEVCKRAEKDILKGNPITGAHHRALEAVFKEWNNAKTK